MRNHLLLAALFLTLSAGGSAQRSAAQAPVPTRGLTGEALPRAGTLEAVLGGSSTSLTSPAVQVTGLPAPGVYQLTFDDPGTGWKETALIGVPEMPLLPAPLLVAYHGYGHTEYDILANTSFFQEARARGWFVIAPLGAHKYNFGVPYAQQNVAYVLDWLLQTVQIDRQRIYGVGFSMGGGKALSFAARHLDPSRAMFAAVVNHTGTSSISHVWWNANNTSLLEHPDMFGGPPSSEAFAYSRVSSMDLDPITDEVDPATDMARNLAHVVTRVWTADQDPLTHLLVQSAALFAWMVNAGHSTQAITVPSNLHSWSTLNETVVLDDLEQQVLTVPRTGTRRLLADRDGRYLYFRVTQEQTGAFTPWRYHLDPAQNRLLLDQTENLLRLTFYTLSAGLDPTQPLKVTIGLQSGKSRQIVLTNYPHAPSAVLRAGQATSNWFHDPVARTVTIFENDGQNYPGWLIVP